MLNLWPAIIHCNSFDWDAQRYQCKRDAAARLCGRSKAICRLIESIVSHNLIMLKTKASDFVHRTLPITRVYSMNESNAVLVLDCWNKISISSAWKIFCVSLANETLANMSGKWTWLWLSLFFLCWFSFEFSRISGFFRTMKPIHRVRWAHIQHSVVAWFVSVAQHPFR